MTATPYLVEALPSTPVVDGVTAAVVCANSSAEAYGMLAARFADADARWTGGTVTSLATPPNDWGGFTMRVLLTKTGQTSIDVSVTGAAASNFATFVGLMVTALNATAIDGAAFSTDTLKVAETTDAKGDWTCQFWLTAPNGAELGDLYVSSITHQGSSGAAVTVALVANGTLSRSVAPTLVAQYA